MTWRRITISAKVSALYVVGFMTIAATAGVLQYRAVHDQMHATVEAAGGNLLQMLQELVIEDPSLLQPGNLEPVAQRLVRKLPDVTQILVVDERARVIAYVNEDNAVAADSAEERRAAAATALLLGGGDERGAYYERDGRSSYRLSRPLRGRYDPARRSDVVGAVSIDMALSPADARLARDMAGSIATVLALLLLVGGSLYWLTQRLFVRPLMRLVRATEEFGEIGRWPGAVVETRDELESLARAFSRTAGEWQRREAQLVEAQRIARFGSWQWDLTTGDLTWSLEAYRQLGYEPGSVVPSFELVLAAVHPEDREQIVAGTQRALETGESVNFEGRFLSADGTTRDFTAHARVTRTDDGRPLLMTGTTQDVTEQKQAAAALAASQAELRALIGAMSDVILVLDTEGRYVKIAETRTPLLYRPGAELLGQSIVDLFPGEVSDFFLRSIRAALDAGSTINVEYSLPIDDRTVWFAGAVSPLTDDQVVWVARDITELKAAVEAQRAAREVAEAANRAKSEFLANMSHEIRTPMNGVMGMVDLALDTDLTAEQRDYLRVAKTSADSLLSLINDVLDFSKIEAGKLELDSFPFRLRDGLADTVGTLALRAHAKGLELALRVAPEVPDALVGDLGRLRQVVVNLVSNAIKFTADGEVVVSVEALVPDGGGAAAVGRGADEVVLHVAVADTGIGIPLDKQSLIFEAFAQADSSTTREYGGTGLGLAIVSRLVDAMGGRVWLESEVGRGSTFHFTVRLAADPRPAAAAERATPTRRAALRDLPVLVVDDNETNRQILEQMLANWAMRPVLADGARAGLAALERAAGTGAAFPLVLLDANMPEMDGFALAERIRENPALAGVTIMMLSSASQRGDAVRCRELGVALHLTKPVRQSQLLDAIVTALGTARLDRAVRTAPPSPAWSGRRRRLRALVVEDNAVNQKLAVSLLTKRGYDVTVADNGKKALAALAADSFDVVLMDVQMPEMGGLEATAIIRQRERAAGGGDRGARTPIIAMTAGAMAGDRERCLAAGMDDYVAKPIRVEELFATIDRVVGTAPAAAAEGAVAPGEASDGTVLDEAVLDEAALLAVAGGDAALVAELADLFLRETPQRLAELRTALEQGDAPALQFAAHTLKGSAASLSAQRVRGAAARLEALARAGDLAAASAAYIQLEAETAHLRRALVALAERSPA